MGDAEKEAQLRAELEGLKEQLKKIEKRTKTPPFTRLARELLPLRTYNSN